MADGSGFTPTLPGFSHVNRYHDKKANTVVAKILPGEFYVSNANEMIATTLGSCVSACIWDTSVKIGGMNHFMLPLTHQQADDVTWGSELSDATRYGNYAMEHLINEILKHGGSRTTLSAKVFGGGQVLNGSNRVGEKNALFVVEYLQQEKIPLISQDLGDVYPRKIMFDPSTGRAKMKKLRSQHNRTLVTREERYQSNISVAPVEGDVELF